MSRCFFRFSANGAYFLKIEGRETRIQPIFGDVIAFLKSIFFVRGGNVHCENFFDFSIYISLPICYNTDIKRKFFEKLQKQRE